MSSKIMAEIMNVTEPATGSSYICGMRLFPGIFMAFAFAVASSASGDGPRLPGIRAQYEKAPQPKKLVVLDGSAHAQFLFQTGQAERVMRELLSWLTAK